MMESGIDDMMLCETFSRKLCENGQIFDLMCVFNIFLTLQEVIYLENCWNSSDPDTGARYPINIINNNLSEAILQIDVMER